MLQHNGDKSRRSRPPRGIVLSIILRAPEHRLLEMGDGCTVSNSRLGHSPVDAERRIPFRTVNADECALRTEKLVAPAASAPQWSGN